MKFKDIFKKLFIYTPPKETPSFTLDKKTTQAAYDVRKDIAPQKSPEVFLDIDENRKYIETRFDYPHNNDVVIRNLTLNGDTKAFVVFYEGMCKSDFINTSIIKPLLELPFISDTDKYKTPEFVASRLITHNQIQPSTDFDSIIDEINFGGCGIFIDGIASGFTADVKGWPARSVQKPENEQSIYGPQEAFAEMLRGNSAQIRKILKTEKLICEKTTLGNISKTRGVIMYLSDVANESLVSEVRHRLNSIAMDYVISIEEVSMMVEDSPLMITGHVLATERPDRVARALSEGRVALILNGSPRALIFPTNAYEMTHAAADAYLRNDFANISRLIRLAAIFISVLLPGLFLAITMFHEEMLPTYLLYAISASRQNVPFPSVIELLLMEFSFEMIREAGIRMPGPLGSILGIVGGLILGQAAVGAKIVSPIMIIIVAITGIGSFATADYSLGWSFRILKFVFILLGSCLGFFGISLGIFAYSVIIAATKSFGVPFLSPLPGNNLYKDAVFVPEAWKMENRPKFLRPKKEKREDKISKKWRVGR